MTAMKPLLPLALLAPVLAAALAPAAVAREPFPGPAARPVYVPIDRVRRAGETVPVPLDPRRVLERMDVVWSDRGYRSQAAVLVDGLLLARRHVAPREQEQVEVGRRGTRASIVVERGVVHVDGVLLHYAAPRDRRIVEPSSITREGRFARVAHFRGDFRSGQRLLLPAAFSGRRIREIHVDARALDFRSRLRLEGAGLAPLTRIVGDGPVVFRLPEGVRDDQDLTLVVDFRATHVGDVRIVLERDGRFDFDRDDRRDHDPVRHRPRGD
jgi:hypothetical protein